MSSALIRNYTAALPLVGMYRPGFPENAGEQYYTYPTENPQYITTERYYGAAEISFLLGPMKAASRDTIRAWYGSILGANDGEAGVTYMDHRKRFLFDCRWQWEEEWRRHNGGTHVINVNLRSPYIWSPPVIAFYSMVDEANKLRCHSLDSAYDLTLGPVGILYRKTSMATINKEIGNTTYALFYVIQNGPYVAAASSALPAYTIHNGDRSTTIFCQMMLRQFGLAGYCYPMYLGPTTSTCRLSILGHYVNESTFNLRGAVGNGLTVADITLNHDVWYDVAVTYDHIAQKAYLYHAPSALSSNAWVTADDFLSEANTLSEGVVEITGFSALSETETWHNLELLKTEQPLPFAQTNSAVQFPMILGAFITPMEFNLLRRWCHLWNKQTSEAWPK